MGAHNAPRTTRPLGRAGRLLLWVVALGSFMCIIVESVALNTMDANKPFVWMAAVLHFAATAIAYVGLVPKNAIKNKSFPRRAMNVSTLVAIMGASMLAVGLAG